MTKQQMIDYVTTQVARQGNQGAIDLQRLLVAMIEELFKTEQGGAVPIVVSIGKDGEKKGTRTEYPITTEQSLINAYIDAAFDNQEATRLFVEDKGVLIGFNFVEIDELTLAGHGAYSDGEFGVYLNKQAGKSYFYHEEHITAIPDVTQGEIDAYNMIFGATYDKVNNKYMLRVAATEFGLTPAEMIIVNEEYNKTATDGNFTALWSNSIAKYIHCAKWFDGFSAFNLHSAFKDSANLITIDLNTPNLKVTNLLNTFYGCSRLEQIAGVIDVQQGTPLSGTFKGCAVLHTFHLHGLNTNLDLKDCPQLSKETISELVENATSINRLTIYVHPNVKNNLDTNPDWKDVAKQIQLKTNVNVSDR